MRWRGRRKSSNVEDRRGARTGRGIRLGKGGGIGAIVLVLVAMYFGVDPSLLLQGPAGSGLSSPAQPPAHQTAEEKEMVEFISVVLADTEDTWHTLFAQINRRYQEPRLVLFNGAVHSACGYASAAVGPFYCPGDKKVYIDLSFYRDLKQRYRAPGDFAQAYVLAHEVGHHVQTLLGISQKVQSLRQRVSKTEANALSVRQELQADCFAGIWAHHAHRTRQLLEQGDVEEALTAASAIGDDRLQRQSQGFVSPESFTHGSSEQRMHWFKVGLSYGKISSCDTFSASRL